MIKNLRKYWIIRLLLYPFSVLYRLLTDLRNTFYDCQLFRVKQFRIPIISIGNITAGGSGKTPFTMLCIDLLKDRYQNIVIVSRGYGRNSKGVQVVSDGQGNIQMPTVGGDEPVMIAKKYPWLPVIASEDRSEGIELAIQTFGADLILLDDAFQHRRVARNCDIVLINGMRRFSDERLLPLGDLREKIAHLKRADIVILNRMQKDFRDKNMNFLDRMYRGPVFEGDFRPNMLVNSRLERADDIHVLNGRRICIFSAIAEPDQFRNMCTDMGAELVKIYVYPDHYIYTSSDCYEIGKECQALNCQYLVTTEKDIVKIDPSVFKDLRLVAVRLQVALNDQKSFVEKLNHFIDIKI